MKRIYLLSILMLLSILVIKSQTIVPTAIHSDLQLVKTSSPYKIENDVTIDSGATLTIEPGVVIKISSGRSINVNGSFIANGTPKDSVILTSLTASDWNIINGSDAHIELNYLKSTGSKCFVSINGGDLKLSHCSIYSNAVTSTYDCIAVHSAIKVLIDSCIVTGKGGTIDGGSKSDAIDLDDCDTCLLLNNQVSYFSDDAIDIGTETHYAFISGNWLQHCNYGVTVGETSYAIVENNVSLENDGGIEVHNGSTVYCNNDVFYNNKVGISAYHAEQTGVESGGNVFLTNCIISQSTTLDIDTMASSTLSINHSLSDKGVLPGDSNIFADPKFVDTANGNFNLKGNSPCIGKGKPDEHGNPTNIGLMNQVPVNPDQINYTKKDVVVLFPNPVNSYLTIDNIYSASKNLKALICDVSGHIILEINLISKKNLVDLNSLPTGQYFVVILNGGFIVQTIQIIKK